MSGPKRELADAANKTLHIATDLINSRDRWKNDPQIMADLAEIRANLALVESAAKREDSHQETRQHENRAPRLQNEVVEKCGACGGSGHVMEGDGDSYPYTDVTCASCGGSGRR